MKNPTSGDFSVMLNSVYAAQHPHHFVYRGYEVETTGNPLTHVVLRGAVSKHGNTTQNYHYEDLIRLHEMYEKMDVIHPAAIIDTNHSNSGKKFKEQIRIASGQKLSYTQEDIKLTGHAIECRINAENPEKGFRPSPGTITDMYLPGGKGIRIDSAIYSGYTIPPYYDSMVAKLIVWAKNRQEAIHKMQSALGEVIIEGIDTNVDYQYGIVNHPDYIEGNIDIEFIERL